MILVYPSRKNTSSNLVHKINIWLRTAQASVKYLLKHKLNRDDPDEGFS